MDVWTRLRLATRPDHQAIEQLPIMARLFAEDFQQAELRLLFERLLVAHRALEAVLAASPEAVAIGYRLRAPLLEADLDGLGGRRALALRPAVPRYDTEAARLGGLYVIEGSILGGQVLRRQLLAHFGTGIAPCLTFYHPYGGDPGPQWRRFRAALDQRIILDSALDEAESAAHATFATMASVLAAETPVSSRSATLII